MQVASKSHRIARRHNRSGTLGPWTLDTRINGRRLRRSLETDDATAAKERAAQIIDDSKNARWCTPHQAECCTLGQIIEMYRKFSSSRGRNGGVKPPTALGNEQAFMRVTSATGPNDTTPASILTPEHAQRWADSVITKYLDAENSDRQRQLAIRTASSTLAQARSLLNRHVLQAYREAGLIVPDCSVQWASAKTLPQMRLDYSPASDEVVAKTFAAIRNSTDTNLKRVFWLAVGCGLRAGEMHRVKRSDFQIVDGSPWIISDSLGKDGLPIRIPVLCWQELEINLPADGEIISGSKYEREESVFRRMSEMMKSIGWTSRKHTHELRAWAISQVAIKHGLDTASQFGRHKDPGLTKRYYGRYIQQRAITISTP